MFWLILKPSMWISQMSRRVRYQRISLVMETMQVNTNPMPLLIGCGVGFVIGSIVGVRQYLRTQRQAADIIADIDNLKND